MKTCRCGGTEFYKNAARPDGLDSQCKDCRRANNAKWKAKNTDRFTKRGSDWRSHLRRAYGITPEEYTAVLAGNGGYCAICRVVPATCLDHDHETGAIREALCDRCNRGLGYFVDSPALLREAAAYLTKHGAASISGGR